MQGAAVGAERFCWRVQVDDPCAAVEQNDADRKPIQHIEGAVLQGPIAVNSKPEPNGPTQVRHETLEKDSLVPAEWTLSSATADIEGCTEVVFGGERDHRVVGDVLRAQDFLEKKCGS
jgi:hypothetical protein